MKHRTLTADLINRVEKMTVVRVVRDSLVHMIPVLIIGAFALILQTFPVSAYQKAIPPLRVASSCVWRSWSTARPSACSPCT